MATRTMTSHRDRAHRPVEERLRERLRRRPHTVEELTLAENLTARSVRDMLDKMKDLRIYYGLDPGAPLSPRRSPEKSTPA